MIRIQDERQSAVYGHNEPCNLEVSQLYLRNVVETTHETSFHQTSIPHLPVEIWSRIFEFATFIPGCMDIDDYPAIAAFTRDHHGICLSNRFKTSMQSKGSFSLVCKYWNAIVQPLRFQHLQITSGEHACVIARILEDMKSGQKDQEGPGKWTLRIDLVLEGVHVWSSRHTRAMSRIFKRCRNLLCFSAALSVDDARTLGLSAIIQELGLNPKLKRMEVQLDDGVLQAINKFLGDQLQVLWLMPYNASTYPPIPTQKIFMPNLRALIATSDSMEHIDGFDLPNLRACILDWGIVDHPVVNKNIVEYLSVSRINDWNLWPNLTTISVSTRVLFLQKYRLQRTLQHSKIECIIFEGIDFKRRKLPDGSMHSQLEENLMIWLSPYQFPKLRCIKIRLPIMNGTHRTQWLPEEEKPFWCAWFHACRSCGVQIEVSEGAMEWTEDHWTRYYHEEVLDIL